MFFALLLHFLLGPVDLFVHLSNLLTNLGQCAVAGGIFYGFSLPLLWRRPLSTGWGMAYAAASLLFLVIVFTPEHIYGSGMMRRVAIPEHSEEHEAVIRRVRTIFQSVLCVVFLVMQVTLLRVTLRTLPPAPQSEPSR